MVRQDRSLKYGDSVRIIYHNKKKTDFIAKFSHYENFIVEEHAFKTPVFLNDKKTISGSSCFWIFPEEASSKTELETLRNSLFLLQKRIRSESPNVPIKVDMADFEENVRKHGDPTDLKWIFSLAADKLDRDWFEFEPTLQQPVLWSTVANITTAFNEKYNHSTSPEEIYQLSLKFHRFVLGSHIERMSFSEPKIYISSARKFEQRFKLMDDRMNEWSEKRNGDFPIVEAISDNIPFDCGVHFNKFVENTPHLFLNVNCDRICKGVLLRVVAYDPETKKIKLDFTKESLQEAGIEQHASKEWLQDEYAFRLDELDDKLKVVKGVL